MNSTRMRSAIFYASCLLVLVVFALQLLSHVLPGTLAHEIDDESEAFPIALLFCAYVQFLRVPWADRGRVLWIVTGVLAAVTWLIAWLLLTLALPSSVVTLNESFVAVGAMILIACLPSSLVAWAPLLSLAVLVLLLAFQSTNFVTAQAESAIPIMLAPIALYWVDQTILQPDAPVRARRRLTWCVLLVVVPVVARAHIGIGSHHDVLQYERRATEGFLGVLLVHLFFSYWLGDRWATSAPERLRSSRRGAAAVSAQPSSETP